MMLYATVNIINQSCYFIIADRLNFSSLLSDSVIKFK